MCLRELLSYILSMPLLKQTQRRREHILSVVINSQVLTSVNNAKEQEGYFVSGRIYILSIHVKALYVHVCLLEHNG